MTVEGRPAVVGLTAPWLRRALPAEPAPRIALTLLGGFVLRIGDEPVDLPTTAQRLFALLALRGRTSRSRLAGTLWPETAEHRALASLRTGIWRVNQVAERLVTCTSGTVELGSGVDVDVQRLIRGALTTLRDATTDSADEVEGLLDDGDELLPDWEDEWLLADRERMRQIRLHALEMLAERLACARHYGLAMEAALAALRVDALRESAHRAVIGIHVAEGNVAEGNVAEARRAFNLCRLVLARGVGVEPSAATTELLLSAVNAPRAQTPRASMTTRAATSWTTPASADG